MPARQNGLRRVLQLAPRSAGNGALALLRDAYVGAAFVRRGGELPPTAPSDENSPLYGRLPLNLQHGHDRPDVVVGR